MIKGSEDQEKKAFKKTYLCPLEVEYPNSEDDKEFIQERVKKILWDSTKSAI